MVQILFSLLALFSCVGAWAGVKVAADDEALAWNGRIDWASVPGAARFSYPGVEARMNFTGEGVRMSARPGSGYFVVEIDDEMPLKVNFDADSVITLAEGLDPGVGHTLRVTYAIEGHQKHPLVRGFEILGQGAALGPKPEPGEMKIEFIGDSMTCAYGVEDESGKGFKYSTQNFGQSFAARAARLLNADYAVVARSGQGIYRNYNGPVTGGKGPAMPDFYDRTLYDKATPKWDFSRFTPDVVVVDLGTNDTSCGVWDVGRMTAAYVKFLKRLRGLYPQAQIVLASGCMRTGEANKAMTEAMDRAKAQMADPEVYRVDMSPQTGSLGWGSDTHPSQRQHAKMGRELARFIRGIRAGR